MVAALPFIAAGTSLLGGVAAVRGAQAQEVSARTQQRIEQRNVDLAERDVETHEQDVMLQVMRYRKQVAEQMDQTRTRFAKSGFDPGMGTAMTIAMETANRADDQIAQIQLDGARAEQQLTEEATGARQRSTIAGLNATSAAQSALPLFGASLLTSATRFGASAHKYGVYGFRT
jgi:uncharacterized glyoxalase superfamily protein PhnB